MSNGPGNDDETRRIAIHWCESRGSAWSVCDQLGAGGTAPVFEITSPDGPRALKVYDVAFSAGQKGEIEQRRIDQQLALRGHECPFLVQVFEGGKFDNRLYLLMSRAPGTELEKRLPNIPRNKVRHIMDQIAKAALFLRSKNLCHRDIKAANIFISNDFDHATLLDISVIRNIYDPMGAGTDHDGQLPVLATARYSPPEYLFRLLEPGPELWHALSIYQLGALLHDLIMKEALFQAEYLKSAENRYRFAWIVATAIPKIQAEDVDQDLVFTAHRALDKNWERRSTLRLEDFCADANVQQAHALQLLGLGSESTVAGPSNETARLQRVRDVSATLEEAVMQFLRKNGVTAKHEVKPGANDTSKLLIFRWEAPAPEAEAVPRKIEFRLEVYLLHRPGDHRFGVSAALSTLVTGAEREVTLRLPEIQDGPGLDSTLASEAESTFAKLALELTRASTGTAGA